jgi:hypothetical protein
MGAEKPLPIPLGFLFMNTGQIVKSRTTERFTTLPNEVIKSKDLSLEDKGLLSYLLSLPSDWVIYKQNLYNSLPDKKGSIDKSFKNLQKKGYILSVKVHDQKTGRFVGWNHVVYDIPAEIEKNRESENPTSEITEFGESAHILNTNVLQKTNLIQNTKCVQKPSISEVEDYFLEKGSTIEAAKKAFEYYDVADWKDSKGKPVKNWKQKMLAVWINNSNFNNNFKSPKTKKEQYEQWYERIKNSIGSEENSQTYGLLNSRNT